MIPLLDKAAGIMASPKSDLKRRLVRNIVRGNVAPTGVFQAGVEFNRSNMIEERVKISQKLARKFAAIPEYAYENLPIKMLNKAVADDPAVRKIDLEEQSSNGMDMWRSDIDGTLKPFDTGLEWIRLFNIVDGDVVDEAHPYNVIPALGINEKRALRAFGGSGSPNIALTTPSRLLAPLRRDKYGRRDISDEEIMDLMSQPGSDAVRNTELLSYLGFSRDAAHKTSMAFAERAAMQVISSNATPFSGNDGFFQMMDFSYNALTKNFNLMTTTNRTLDGSLLQIALMRSFYNGFKTGVFRKGSIVMTGEEMGRILQITSKGAQYTRSLHLSNVYPNRLWTDKTTT
jgi:hypothetical protein